MLSVEKVKEHNKINKQKKLEFLEIKIEKKFLKYDVIIKTTYIDETKQKVFNKEEKNPVIQGRVIATIPILENRTIIIEKKKKSIIIIEKGEKREIKLKEPREMSIGIYL